MNTTGAIDIWKKLIGVLEIGEHRPGISKLLKNKLPLNIPCGWC